MRQNKPYILLVEPRPEYAMVTAAELSKIDCEVALARTPDEARQLLNVLPHNHSDAALIMLDVSTDEGSEFAAELFNRMMDGTLASAPIVGLAPVVSLEIEAAAHAAGCDLVLNAPLGPGGAQLVQQLATSTLQDEVVLLESILSYADRDAELVLA
jgi:CheY-like chemotaxis protein